MKNKKRCACSSPMYLFIYLSFNHLLMPCPLIEQENIHAVRITHVVRMRHSNIYPGRITLNFHVFFPMKANI